MVGGNVGSSRSRGLLVETWSIPWLRGGGEEDLGRRPRVGLLQSPSDPGRDERAHHTVGYENQWVNSHRFQILLRPREVSLPVLKDPHGPPPVLSETGG